MWAEILSLFLLVTLTAYVLFGGADFGGGILEATLKEHGDLQKRLQSTLAPVWEANHVWLIAVVVILFVGFPVFYATALTRLFVPISLSLLFILLRGAFFTFRKYDPNPGEWSILYSFLFRFSSIGAPLCFGFVVSGLMHDHPGDIHELPTNLSFSEVYIHPWFNNFGCLCGVFVATLFTYMSSIFFYGELDNNDHEFKQLIYNRILIFFISTFLLGAITLFFGAYLNLIHWLEAFDPIQLVTFSLASIGIFGVWMSLKKRAIWHMRFWAGSQVFFILLGWSFSLWPTLMKFENEELTIYDAAAPKVVLIGLAAGFCLVLALVIPGLVILYKVFHRSSSPSS